MDIVEMRKQIIIDVELLSFVKKNSFLSFNNDEIDKMLEFAFYELGDQDYDDTVNHHGSGENRALAFRSGLAFGRSKGQYKDNYYKMFCLAK